MKRIPMLVPLILAATAGLSGCVSRPVTSPAEIAPEPLDRKRAEEEVRVKYKAAHPEIQEYVLWTAISFGPSGMWLNEDAFAGLSAGKRDRKIVYLATLLEGGEYGRHLCRGLAEAGAIKDDRLVPGLLKVAGYQKENADYDCRPKWMAVAALARQESGAAVPLLVSLVDHGNENTRKWARAALARLAKQDLGADKSAWAKWWQSQGHAPLDEKWLKPWTPPPSSK
jgi:HEAT repeat protein